MKRVAFALLLGSLGCGGSTPGAPADAGIDAPVCADTDGSFVAASNDLCDGIDNDCNGVVDDGPSITSFFVLYHDADGDGFGDRSQPVYDACLRPGYVLVPVNGGVFDCDDGNASAPPGPSPVCDYDGDGDPGATDCDDHNPLVYSYARERCNGVDDDCDALVDDADQVGSHDPTAQYVLDTDGDGYPSSVVFACTPPGGGYVADPWPKAQDCAPLDPAIHPGQFDDCASATDTNCDGVFTPVDVQTWGNPSAALGIIAALVPGTPSDPVTTLPIPGDFDTSIGLCPGHYRVSFDVGLTAYSYGTLSIRGRGASPSDVVLDAGGSTFNVNVPQWLFPDTWRTYDVNLGNLTVQDGHASSGGCITGWPDEVSLDGVVLRGCRADVGGAIAGAGRLHMNDTFFVDTVATALGGAIAFSGLDLRMTGGGFTNTAAPAGAGSAIWANLAWTNTLDLTSVDLSAVGDDIAVTTTNGSFVRDLGANATLHCDVSTGCTP